jgi:phosphatidylethanolamine/phosphatidyl-N-methylethanolamine N-methyltransferase
MADDKDDPRYGSPSIFYSDYYERIIFGAGTGAKAVRYTHVAMERPFRGKSFHRVLEVGGGNGEHLDFIQHDFDRYVLTDLRKPELKEKWASDSRITVLIENAEELSFENASFDRVVSTCLLHHVERPERVLQEIDRVLKPNGMATIFLSCDPGMAVRALRSLTTMKRAKKEGFRGYALMNARDHRNHVGSLLEMTKYVFRNRRVKLKWSPFGIRSWNLNGYVIINIS